MLRSYGIWTIVVLVGAGLLRTALADAGPALDVRYDAPRLTVRSDGVPLDEVLRAVGRETGMTIEGTPQENRMVHAHFADIPLGDALERLLGKENFIVSYDVDGVPARLQIFGGPQAPPEPASQRVDDALRRLLGHPKVAVPSRAAEALGGAELAMTQVLIGFRHDDPLVREECVQVVVRTIQGDLALTRALRKVNPKQLTDFVVGFSGVHSADVALRLYRTTRDVELQARFAAVMTALRQQGR